MKIDPKLKIIWRKKKPTVSNTDWIVPQSPCVEDHLILMHPVLLVPASISLSLSLTTLRLKNVHGSSKWTLKCAFYISCTSENGTLGWHTVGFSYRPVSEKFNGGDETNTDLRWSRRFSVLSLFLRASTLEWIAHDFPLCFDSQHFIYKNALLNVLFAKSAQFSTHPLIYKFCITLYYIKCSNKVLQIIL